MRRDDPLGRETRDTSIENPVRLKIAIVLLGDKHGSGNLGRVRGQRLFQGRVLFAGFK